MSNPVSEHVYVLELTDGVIKVGRTGTPALRLMRHARSLGHAGVQISRRWVSPRHMDAGASEDSLIGACGRLGGTITEPGRSEWFTGLRFDDVVAIAEALPFAPRKGAEILPIEGARKELGGIVDRARWKGEPAVITRTGKPAAAIVPADLCEHVQAAIGEGGEQ